ncbi:MAG: hypothetical protein J5530_02620 [Clostridia bacterium]|nr:hypothetical protein [Clostridia bacterium]
MSNKTIFRAHRDIFRIGRFCDIAGLTVVGFMLYGATQVNLIGSIIMLVIVAIFLMLSFFFRKSLVETCWAKLVVYDDRVVWRCVFHVPVTLYFDKIEHAAVGKHDDSGTALRIDVFNTGVKQILLSYSPFPNKAINLIESKKGTIKFPYEKKLADLLAEKLSVRIDSFPHLKKQLDMQAQSDPSRIPETAKAVFRAHPMLVVEGRLFVILGLAVNGLLLFILGKEIVGGELKEKDILLFAVWFVGMALASYVLRRILWYECWGKVTVYTDKVVWRCVLRKPVTLYFDDIKYADIREMGEANDADLYHAGNKYILLSVHPFPEVSVKDMYSKDGLIKIKYNNRLAEILKSKLQPPLNALFAVHYIS